VAVSLAAFVVALFAALSIDTLSASGKVFSAFFADFSVHENSNAVYNRVKNRFLIILSSELNVSDFHGRRFGQILLKTLLCKGDRLVALVPAPNAKGDASLRETGEQLFAPIVGLMSIIPCM
jgi:hypothetical protein